MFMKVVRGAGIAALGLSAVMALVPTAASAAPELKVLVIDQQAVLRDSLAGQDIARQAAALRDQIQGEVAAEQKAILSAQKDLQSNASVYSPAQREQKLKALDARQLAYPVFEQRKTQVLQASIGQASDQVAAALRPVLQSLIDENHATLLLDRSDVMYALPAYDVTQEAIKRLNAKITSVKVVRVNLDTAPQSVSAAARPAGVLPVAAPKVTTTAAPAATGPKPASPRPANPGTATTP